YRSTDRGGSLRRPAERRVEITCLDDVEPAEVFLGLGEGAVGCHDIAVGNAYDRGGFRLQQSAGEDQGARRLHLLLEGEDLLPGPLDLFFGHRRACLAAVGGEHVLGHRTLLRLGRAGPTSHPSYERTSPILTRTR